MRRKIIFSFIIIIMLFSFGCVKAYVINGEDEQKSAEDSLEKNQMFIKIIQAKPGTGLDGEKFNVTTETFEIDNGEAGGNSGFGHEITLETEFDPEMLTEIFFYWETEKVNTSLAFDTHPPSFNFSGQNDIFSSYEDTNDDKESSTETEFWGNDSYSGLAQFGPFKEEKLSIESTVKELNLSVSVWNAWSWQVINYKEYKVNIKFKFKFKASQKAINKAKAEAAQKALEDAGKNPPAETATAEEIATFIYSDEKYHNSENLKKVANENLDKIKAWYKTIKDSTNSQHKGAIEKLKAIVEKDDDTTVDQAIDSVNTEQYIKNMEDKIKDTYQMNTAAGEERPTIEYTDVITNIGDFIPNRVEPPEEFVSVSNVIFTVITNIGMVVSALILAILGIKYMLGSVEEKAEYKKDMIPYLVGAVLIFGITIILNLVIQIGGNINNL